MARYTVVTKDIHVVGRGWYGQTMAYTYRLSDYDIENMGDFTDRESVFLWLDCNAGDFSYVDDFCVDVDEYNSGWATEEGEILFNDCMYGDPE